MPKPKNPDLITNDDYVICQVCGRKFTWIQNKHLDSHLLTLEQYKEKYPGCPTKTKRVHERIKQTRGRNTQPMPICAREGCNNPVKSRKNKYCSYECNGKVRAQESFKSYTTTEGNPGYLDGKYSHGKTQKQLAFERDKGYCQRCNKQLDGIKNKYGVHHLIPRRTFKDYKDADILENLVTLCSKCHKDVETELVDHLIQLHREGRQLSDTGLMMYLRNKI